MEKKVLSPVATFWTVVIVIALIGFAIYGSQNSGSTSNNPTTNVKADTEVPSTSVQVARFYNGEDGYSLSIPSGNSSTCIWTWAGGNADIPYSQTTYANTATEKHTITFPSGVLDSLYDFKVNCTDDFGNQYVGVFPNSNS
jgi:hypothetical protein